MINRNQLSRKDIEVKEPIQITLPKSTRFCAPQQDNVTVCYQAGLHKISYEVKNGQVVFNAGWLVIRKMGLRSVRGWCNWFQPREVWVETQRFEDVYIYSTSGSNRLFTSDNLAKIVSKHINEGSLFGANFLDWLLSPTEDKLNEILREANEQIRGSEKVVRLAAA
jgi:hypothetical protein